MAKLIEPLAPNVPIVDKDGNPTPYFARILREINEARFSASLMEFLDSLGSEHGSIIYRDEDEWDALPPGDSGDVLTSGGTGADPTWEPGGAGGDFGVFHVRDKRAVAGEGGTFTSGAWRSRGLNETVSNTITDATMVTATVTMTIASPCVVTWTGHGLVAGQLVTFTTTGALPTGLTATTSHYYVIAAGLTANTFQISATEGGAAINTSGSQSGTHTGIANQFLLPEGTYDVSIFVPAHQCEVHQGRLQNLTDASTTLVGIPMRSRQTSATDGANLSHIRGRIILAGTKRFEVQHRCSATQANNGFGTGAANTWDNSLFSEVWIRKVSE